MWDHENHPEFQRALTVEAEGVGRLQAAAADAGMAFSDGQMELLRAEARRRAIAASHWLVHLEERGKEPPGPADLKTAKNAAEKAQSELARQGGTSGREAEARAHAAAQAYMALSTRRMSILRSRWIFELLPCRSVFGWGDRTRNPHPAEIIAHDEILWRATEKAAEAARAARQEAPLWLEAMRFFKESGPR